ncbi:MAG: hypothetical protein M3Q19_02105 [Pseudomonadota bacterium]|nr:hypothetical protein [Pseudomonadota bacterium]
MAACSTAPAQESRSPAAARELANALAGRVAGPPRRCITTYRATKVTPIDDFTILYDQGSTIYVQNPRGGCPGIGSGSDILVTRQTTNQLCDGEIAQTVDLTSRVERGGCVFGPFVPYSKPR